MFIIQHITGQFFNQLSNDWLKYEQCLVGYIYICISCLKFALDNTRHIVLKLLQSQIFKLRNDHW